MKSLIADFYWNQLFIKEIVQMAKTVGIFPVILIFESKIKIFLFNPRRSHFGFCGWTLKIILEMVYCYSM